MPMYDYSCPGCGMRFDRYLSLKNYAQKVSCPDCGKAAIKQISAPAVVPDYEGYESPVTGRWIEGRVAHKEELRRTGCVVREAGMREHAAKVRAEREHAAEVGIERAVEQVFSEITK